MLYLSAKTMPLFSLHNVIYFSYLPLLGIHIYHRTSLAKTLNKTKRFDYYTVVIVSGEYKTKDKLALSTLKKGGKRVRNQNGSDS